MRFNRTKPILPESDAVGGDEFASSDLEMLAEQLRQDALFLASKYPARLPSELPEIPLVRRIAPALWSGAVAAVLLMGVGLWSLADGSLGIDAAVQQRHPSLRRFEGQRHRTPPARREMP